MIHTVCLYYPRQSYDAKSLSEIKPALAGAVPGAVDGTLESYDYGVVYRWQVVTDDSIIVNSSGNVALVANNIIHRTLDAIPPAVMPAQINICWEWEGRSYDMGVEP